MTSLLPFPSDPASSDAWTPQPDVLLHNGGPIPPEMDFFDPPPLEIGRVISAHSRQRKGKRPWSPEWWAATFFTLLLALPFLTCMSAFIYLGPVAPNRFTDILVWSVMLIGVASAAVFACNTRVSHEVSYIGEFGAARAWTEGSKGRISKRQLLKFPEAKEFYRRRVNQRNQTAYAGTPYTYVWVPPAGVTAHHGDPILPNMDFFAPPSPEIGMVLTAYSQQRKGKHPWTPLGWTLAIFALMFVFPFLTCLSIIPFIRGSHAGPGDRVAVLQAIVMGLSVALVVIFIFIAKRSHEVSYVGELGIARIWTYGKYGRISGHHPFQFAAAADLYTHRENILLGYGGTKYTFTWRDTAGKEVFKLAGSYFSKEGTPIRNSPYYLAISAESAWTDLFLKVYAAELREHGYLYFKVNKSDALHVGPRFLQFTFDGRTTRITSEEIGKIIVSSGRFTIYHKDAKLFSNTGKFTIYYANMANSHVFLLALETLCGYRFS